MEATGGFFLLAAWLNYLDRDRIVPLVMAACLLHELGHYLAIRLLKYISQKGSFGGFAYYCWGIGLVTLILSLVK